MTKQLVKKNNISQLRNIIREESRYGSLQAQLMLQGCDLDTIQDNEVIEYKTKEKQSTPLLRGDFKKDKRNDRIYKGILIIILILLAVYDLADVSLLRTIIDIMF